MEKHINKHLLGWYKNNKRDLPWRRLQANKLPNPYYIFVSEYMLQQTTVPTVKKRFEEFIKKWPNIKKLSLISESKILNFWVGLGYYTRARNLLKAAKLIQKNYRGRIPENFEDLINLPGIGDYTAKAILGIAFNQAFIPLDANIERIISRIFAYQLPIIKIKKQLEKKSIKFISKKYSSQLIQAFMDYGSLICTPRNPKCKICLFNMNCKSYSKNLQNQIPVKNKKISKKLLKFSRAYIFNNEKNEILIRKRPSKGMLASMFEVPNDVWVNNKKDLIKDKLILNIKNKIVSKGLVKYSFTHFDLETEVFIINVKKNKFLNYRWIKQTKITKSGLPTLMKKIVAVAI
ncbi:MAG: hypothetical protein CMI96_03945 [Pelagibacteraceae bacterium]|nr:hypothetical protein [Pelagibacteraceae bacterium]|tara:strand:+ start:38271 stop:39311 length:1041 start_codon:yes stop_codon:yes gene_type:complete